MQNSAVVCALQRGSCALYCVIVPSYRHLKDPQYFLQNATGSSLYWHKCDFIYFYNSNGIMVIAPLKGLPLKVCIMINTFRSGRTIVSTDFFFLSLFEIILIKLQAYWGHALASAVAQKSWDFITMWKADSTQVVWIWDVVCFGKTDVIRAEQWTKQQTAQSTWKPQSSWEDP